VVRLGLVQRYPLCQMRVRRGAGSHEHRGRPQALACPKQHGYILGLLRQGEELLTEGIRRLQLGMDIMIVHESTQDGEQPVRVCQMVAELLSPRVRFSDFRSRKAFGVYERDAHGNVHIYGLLDAIRGCRQPLE